MLGGPHIALRAVERDDLPQLLEWRNDPALRRFFREHRELNTAQQVRWFEDVVCSDDNTLMFSIVGAEDGTLQGAAGLCRIDWVNRSADLSIYIGTNGQYVDKTRAAEAAGLLIDYGFDELSLHRLWAEVYEYDDAKRGLLELLGFQLEGRHREAHFAGREWHDSLFYGLLAVDPALQD